MKHAKIRKHITLSNFNIVAEFNLSQISTAEKGKSWDYIWRPVTQKILVLSNY